MMVEANLKSDATVLRPNLARAWWPAVVWIGLIVMESSDFFSSRNTGSVLYTILTRLFGEIDFYKFLVFHHYLRKTGHVVGYGMLSLLLLRGWRATLGWVPALLLRAALLSWLGTAFVAAMDEWHQSHIPSRTGTIWDVGLDTLAGVVFLVVAFLWLRRSREEAA
ncbi:MAG: VanZ family protein [Terriglobales bacterium]